MKTKIASLTGLVLLAGCDQPEVEKPTPLYPKGTVVKFKIAPEVAAMVVDTWCGGRSKQCVYRVRVYRKQSVTGTSIFGDGPVVETPIGMVEWIREFELEPK